MNVKQIVLRVALYKRLTYIKLTYKSEQNTF